MAIARRTEAEKQAILRDGPYCALARWRDDPPDDTLPIQCRRLGANAHRWLPVDSRSCACYACRESAEYNGRDDDEENERAARRIAAHLPADEAQAETMLDWFREAWGMDDNERARGLLTRALALAPGLSGLPAQAALRIAQRKGLVTP